MALSCGCELLPGDRVSLKTIKRHYLHTKTDVDKLQKVIEEVMRLIRDLHPKPGS
jgi:molybdopterin/thiamine biosynthesis adenylyltransferase